MTFLNKKFIFFIIASLFFSLFLLISIDIFNFNKVDFVYYKDFKPGYSCQYNLNQIDFFDYEEKLKVNQLSKMDLGLLNNFENYRCINKIIFINDGWPEVRIGIGDDNIFFQLIKNAGLLIIFIFFINFYPSKDKLFGLTIFLYNLFSYLLFSFDFKFRENKFLYSYEIFFVEIIILYLIFLHLSENRKLDNILENLNNFFQNLQQKHILFISSVVAFRSLYVFLNNTYFFNIPDWLINYNFGYVRRGFSGTLLLMISEDLNFVSYKLLPLITIILHFSITYLALSVFQENSKNMYSVFLLLSPLFILFPVFNVSKGAGNKEAIGILIFLLLIRYSYKKIDKKKIFLISLFIGFSLFTHEVNIFILIFVVLSSIFLKIKIDKLLISSILIFSALLIISIFLFPSNEEIPELLCENIFLNIEKIDCSKSSWLQQDFNESLRISILRIFEDYQYLFVYGIYFFLSILPLLMSGWIGKNLRLNILVLLIITPLFLIAIDWGRWLSILIHFLTIIYFVNLGKNKSGIQFNLKNLITLIFYTTLWRVPQCCVEEVNITYLFRFDKYNFLIYIYFAYLILLFSKYNFRNLREYIKI